MNVEAMSKAKRCKGYPIKYKKSRLSYVNQIEEVERRGMQPMFTQTARFA